MASTIDNIKIFTSVSLGLIEEPLKKLCVLPTMLNGVTAKIIRAKRQMSLLEQLGSELNEVVSPIDPSVSSVTFFVNHREAIPF
jgi:hypothetical protein